MRVHQKLNMHTVKAGVHYTERRQDRKGCGSKLCHFGILSASDAEKCANHRSLGHYYTVLFVLTADIPGSVLGINPEGIKTVSGIFQEYAERLLNECGFTKFGFRVLSAP